MSMINATQFLVRAAPKRAHGHTEETRPEQSAEPQGRAFARELSEVRTGPVPEVKGRPRPERQEDHDERPDAVDAEQQSPGPPVAVPVVIPQSNAAETTPSEGSESGAIAAAASGGLSPGATATEAAMAALEAAIAATADATATTAASAETNVSAGDAAQQPATAATAVAATSAAATSAATATTGNKEPQPADVLAQALAAVKPEPKPEAKVSEFSVAIQAAAAREGKATEESANGRRLGEVVVSAVREGHAQESTDGQPQGRTIADLVRQAIDGASKASGQQPDAVVTTSALEAEALKPVAPKAESGADMSTDVAAALGSTSDAHAGAKPRVEAATDTARASVPDSVTVRDTGDAIIRSVHYLSGKTDEVVTVRLVPRSLGELQVAVRTSANGVDVVLTTSTAAARDAIEGNLAVLRQAMGREGLDVSRVTVQVAAPFDAGYQATAGQHGQAGQHNAAGQLARQAPAAYRDSGSTTPRDGGQRQDRRQRHDGRLNMWA